MLFGKKDILYDVNGLDYSADDGEGVLKITLSKEDAEERISFRGWKVSTYSWPGRVRGNTPCIVPNLSRRRPGFALRPVACRSARGSGACGN